MSKKIFLLLLVTALLFNCNNDDDLVAACETVTNVSSNSITNNSANITWDSTNSSALYTVEYGVTGFALGTGTTLSESETMVMLTNLEANTTYDVYIQSLCASDNTSMYSEVYSFTTWAPNVVTEFRPSLSELNLFTGNLADLQPSPYAFKYDLNTKLFTDYATKQRLIVLPEGQKMSYDGDGLPIFPDNTLISKTFYYNNNDTDLSQGKKIIETRILLKINGVWETGDYIWNESQTDAVLDGNGGIVPVTWINSQGQSQSVDYEIPTSTQCIICHSNNAQTTPIGPKLRTLNFDIAGSNQLQTLIDNDMLEGLTDPSVVSVLPNWEDTSLSLDRRARAYMDINCAHCHIQGGFCEEQSTLRLSYETAFEESNIYERSNSILSRIQNTIPEYGMPYIGTTILHDEGVAVMIDYINSIQ